LLNKKSYADNLLLFLWVKEMANLKCPNCGETLTYLNVPRTMFTVEDGKPDYHIMKNTFNCPFCDYGIAGDEELAKTRLETGRRRGRRCEEKSRR
jgi:ssDNA-binding Zn-finger/Zn-ribbon topoisomerase 1